MRPPISLGIRPLVIAAALHATAVIGAVAQTPTRSLWEGVFTTEQVARGRAQYAVTCARCHGGSLEGGMGASLVGTAFWNEWREQSVADMVDYVAKNMPMGRQAAPLSPTEAADLVAFVLSNNDLPARPVALSATSGTGIRIVPKDGGTGELPPTTLARVVVQDEDDGLEPARTLHQSHLHSPAARPCDREAQEEDVPVFRLRLRDHGGQKDEVSGEDFVSSTNRGQRAL